MSDTTFSTTPNKQTRLIFWLLYIPLVAGFILSIMSWLHICVEHCSATKDYRLFNIPLAFVGIIFFSLLILFHSLSRQSNKYSLLVAWMIASGLGAEIMLIAIQKYQIGHWCPVCLSIALSLSIAALGIFGNKLYSLSQQKNRGQMMMNHFKKAMATSTSFFFIGFLLTFVGVAKPNPAQAAAEKMRERLEFGNKTSPIEVFFVTDWFCPSCKKVEPLIEKIYPKIQARVGFFFIDFPIHTKSENYSPYNLAFLLNNKSQYFAARDILMKMTNEIESPTDEDIEKAAKKAGIKFKEITYLEVKSGMTVFDEVIDKYKLDSTPTIIVLNTKTNKFTKLEGNDEISEEKIMKAIDGLEKEKTSHASEADPKETHAKE